MRLATTSPTTSLRRPCTFAVACVLVSAIIVSPLFLLTSGRALALAEDRFDARNVLAQAANLLQALRLSHVQLKFQLEQLVGKLALLVAKLNVRQVSDFVYLHKFLNRILGRFPKADSRKLSLVR